LPVNYATYPASTPPTGWLATDGVVISGDMVLEGVRAWVEEARAKTWMPRDSIWEVEPWLELFPFSDHLALLTEGLDLVSTVLRPPQRMERLVKATASAPGEEAEHMLLELARGFRGLASAYDWAAAFLQRGTVSAAIKLIDLAHAGILRDDSGAQDKRWVAQNLGARAKAQPELRREVLSRYQSEHPPPLLEAILSEIADEECARALVQGYVRQRKPFDHRLAQVMRDAAVERRPADGWAGAFELHPVLLSALRKELFGLLAGAPQEAALGAAALGVIDEQRDEYGALEFEPRHPDVESRRPWPLEAGVTEQHLA
jgi:hypothetical protein